MCCSCVDIQNTVMTSCKVCVGSWGWFRLINRTESGRKLWYFSTKIKWSFSLNCIASQISLPPFTWLNSYGLCWHLKPCYLMSEQTALWDGRNDSHLLQLFDKSLCELLYLQSSHHFSFSFQTKPRCFIFLKKVYISNKSLTPGLSSCK